MGMAAFCRTLASFAALRRRRVHDRRSRNRRLRPRLCLPLLRRALLFLLMPGPFLGGLLLAQSKLALMLPLLLAPLLFLAKLLRPLVCARDLHQRSRPAGGGRRRKSCRRLGPGPRLRRTPRVGESAKFGHCCRRRGDLRAFERGRIQPAPSGCARGGRG
jgi:hypothetical protein